LQHVCAISLFLFFTWHKTLESINFSNFDRKQSWHFLCQILIFDNFGWGKTNSLCKGYSLILFCRTHFRISKQIPSQV
jgi:hypothetical protein